MFESATKCNYSWEFLFLVSQHLDPISIAKASCVCKTWYLLMSSDDIWQLICSNAFNSLANLKLANPTVPYSKLYAIGYTSSKRRYQKPPKPSLTLNNILFSIDITTIKNTCIASIIKHGCDLVVDVKDPIFRFDIDVHVDSLVEIEALDNLRMTWNIVLEDFGGVFNMMNCKGEARFVFGIEGWFCEDLPVPGCCSSVVPSQLAADVRLGLGLREGGGKVLIEKVSVGVLNMRSLRYEKLDDILRYLQQFLLLHS